MRPAQVQDSTLPPTCDPVSASILFPRLAPGLSVLPGCLEEASGYLFPFREWPGLPARPGLAGWASQPPPHPSHSLRDLLPPPPRLAPMASWDPDMTPKKPSNPSSPSHHPPHTVLATLYPQWCLGGQGNAVLLSSNKDDCGVPEPPKLSGRIGVRAGRKTIGGWKNPPPRWGGQSSR